MLNTIFGIKEKMVQTFVDEKRLPVTWLKVEPCIVSSIKKLEKDGYWAIQVGIGKKTIRKAPKYAEGKIKGVIEKKTTPRFLREIKTGDEPELKVGDFLKPGDIFSVGDMVSVSGISKGKGFAGVVKRHGFKGGPRTHGQSDRERAPGSIGQTTTPGRVFRGKRMAGRMGQDTVTVKNLRIVDVNEDKNEIAISGAVPGSPGSLIKIVKLSQKASKEG